MTIRLNDQKAVIRVCVDIAENGKFCGRIVAQRLSEPIPFMDIHEFLFQIDAVLDVQKFPQAFQRKRSFTEKGQPDVPAVLSNDAMQTAETVNIAFGAVSTFHLSVYSRQNVSWQGRITWLDDSPPEEYHSSLELIKVICRHLHI